MPTLRTLAGILLLATLAACSDDDNGGLESQLPESTPPDFTAANNALRTFMEEHPVFEGTSMVLVERGRGVINRVNYGNHTNETVVLLASASKMPVSTLLMALSEDDENVDFEIDAVIDQYLPYDGIWTGRTTEQLVSNTSGIPGLSHAFDGTYGAHLCQYLPVGQLQDCAQTIYQSIVPGAEGRPPNQLFEYGGSQWHLAGAVAEIVGGASLRQLWDQYVAEPCGLEVFQWGNNLSFAVDWTGNPDDLQGLENPNAEGGAMSTVDDYGRFLQIHLDEGRCGDNQIISQEAIEFMRIDRAAPLGGAGSPSTGYGMGWWTNLPEDGSAPHVYYDPGFYAAVSWVDIERNYGGFVAFEDYTGASSSTTFLLQELIPMIEEALDAVR